MQNRVMLALLVVVLFGIFFSILATQNTFGVPVQLFSYQFANVPIYLVALFSLLAGVLLSSGLSILDWVSTVFTLHGKDTRIRNTEHEVATLQKRIDELKEENRTLRDEKHEVKEEAAEKIEEEREHHTRPGFIDRFRHSLSI